MELNNPGSSSVVTDGTLTGNGTGGNPLGVKGWPLPYTGSGSAFASFIVNPNSLVLCGLVIPYEVSFADITFQVDTPDAGGSLSDYGIYNAAGTLIANVGAQSFAVNLQTLPTLQGRKSIPPGVYWAAVTTNGATLVVDGNQSSPFSLYFNQAFGASTGGALPATIVPPAYAVNSRSLGFALT